MTRLFILNTNQIKMITEQTVFIIGAGGSKPFGFPTGQDLREDICLNYHNKFLSLLNDVTGKWERDIELQRVNNFTKSFYQSKNKSIDLFLSRNPDFSTSGKRAITIEIQEAERNFLNSGMEFLKDDWYSYLFNRMTETMIRKNDFNRFNENKVSFITFNYDRTLEYFLENSLSNSFRLTPENLSDQLNKISFHHVFGQIGFLPWQVNEPTIYFGQKCNLDMIETIQKNIKIIYDYEKGVNEEIIDKIKAAERIYFLGFGYAEENLKLLKIPEVLSTGQKIFGTAMDYLEEEIKKTKFKLHGKWVTNFQNDMLIENCDCLTLLRKYL